MGERTFYFIIDALMKPMVYFIPYCDEMTCIVHAVLQGHVTNYIETSMVDNVFFFNTKRVATFNCLIYAVLQI